MKTRLAAFLTFAAALGWGAFGLELAWRALLGHSLPLPSSGGPSLA
ncbi:hypothetical protein Q5H93_15555 [Hymenobacter sp. ASUV-10]|uniref:EamA family transporter n=1 Tax=Hymenobacter aranciens TaxID=3063996 RepID=A0ABT9BEH3_9BACT|nr:hypothetical protein [Hymenobacter sp. ASUV-10]MDO7876160.1 hypothetical protein [Hymenobacter sp. ASUV-10]